MVWGGPPCTRCCVHIIQAGIDEIVSYPPKAVPSRWAEDLAFARGILNEAGILYREVTPDAGRRVLNYLGILTQDGGDVAAKFPDLPGCEAFGYEYDPAMAASCEAVSTWVKKAIGRGMDLPEQRGLDELCAHDPDFLMCVNKGGAIIVVTVEILSDGGIIATINGRPDIGGVHQL
jgi:predicted RNase H-like HicB family nuclease